MITEETYIKPTSIAEALENAKSSESFKYIAGGTDLMVNLYQGNEDSVMLIDLSQISSMKKVEVSGDYLKIGALVRLCDLSKHAGIKSEFPALIEAADSVGSPLIRKAATIGGNILCENRCLYYNQSEWWRESIGKCLKCEGDVCIATGGKKSCYSELVSDTCPALIAMGAMIEIQDEQGSRQITLEELYSGDGVRPRNLSKHALVTSILLPLHKEYTVVFKKLRQRKSLEFTSLTTAASKDRDGNLIIALSGVDPGPVVIRAKVGEDKEILISQALRKSRAIDNDMLTRTYRRQMITAFLNTSFSELKI